MATTENWSTHGDFNLDGTVDFNDLVPLAQHYNTSILPPAGAELSTAFAADWSVALHETSVPEPVSLFLSVAFAGLVARRRKI